MRIRPSSRALLILGTLALTLVLPLATKASAEPPSERPDANSPTSATARPVHYVIPAGSDEELRRLLDPLLSAPPLPIRGVSVERSIIVLTLDADEIEATVALHHTRQRPGRSSADFSVALQKARLTAEVTCPQCSSETLEMLRQGLRSLDDRGWRNLWLSPEEAPRQPASIRTMARKETRLRAKLGAMFGPLAAALVALILIMVQALRSQSPTLPVQATPAAAGPPDAALGGSLRWYDAAVIGGLLILTAWPVYQSPIVDAGLARLLDLVYWPFECPGHPAPPFLLIKPFAAVSLESWVVRLPLLAILLSLTLLVSFVSGWAGGRWAGLLAGLWMVFEVRRRHGLFDIAFWDLGALFAVALLLWLLVVERQKKDPGPLMWLALVLCMVGGLYSSWLFVVPAGLAVFCVGLLALRGRVRWLGLGAVSLVLGLMALRVLIAFVRVGDTPIGSQGAVVADLLLHTPVGRSTWMVVPLVAGAGWLLMRLCRPWERLASSVYVLFSAPAVILALFVMGGVKYVTGGYYLQLVSGPMIHMAALGAALLIGTIGRLFVTPWRRRAAGAATMLALVVLTFRIPHGAPMEDVDGVEHMGEFDRISRADDLPILTNDHSVDLLIGYQRGRTGELWDRGILAHVFRRMVPLHPVTCALNPRGYETRFEHQILQELAHRSQDFTHRHFVVFNKNEREDHAECWERLTSECRMLFEESRVYNYFSCETDVLGVLTALLPGDDSEPPRRVRKTVRSD